MFQSLFPQQQWFLILQSGALGSTGAELPPEQAEATIATVAMTAKKRCLNPIGFTLLHILSNYGSGALEHWVSGVFRLRN